MSSPHTFESAVETEHVKTQPASLSGVVRVDARARKLAARMEPGDIAVIDFRDLDRATAQAFVAAGASAVLNAAESMTGRYPNLGPLVLLEAGITLVDDLGPDVMTLLEGNKVVIKDGEVIHKGKTVATGKRMTVEAVREATSIAREGFATQIQAFAATTGEYLERESALLMSGSGLPELSISLEDRVVVVVLDDKDSPAQLRAARAWLNDTHPLVIAVDGGAEIAAQARLKPSVIVGDMEIITEKQLRSGAELIVGSGDQHTAGADRLKRMGLDYHTVTTAASAADIAILLATMAGAKAVVTAGEHATFDDFLDRGRNGMAAAFFTRLRAGGKLIALPAVAATYKPRVRLPIFVLLIVSAMVALGAALFTTPLGQDVIHEIATAFSSTADVPASVETN